MSGDDKQDERSEAASEKKIRDAIESGNVPVSRDASALAAFAAALLICGFVLRSATAVESESLATLFDSAGRWRIGDGRDAQQVIEMAALNAARFLVPVLVVLIGCALAFAFAQNPPRLILSRIQPDLSRISVSKGLQRLFGARGAMEFAKAAAKLIFVSAAAVTAIRPDLVDITESLFHEPGNIPGICLTIAIHVLSAVAAMTFLIAAADVFWARHQWRQNLRMSRQDMKDEFRQSEGNPLVKARMRSISLDRARRRMMAGLPRATIVIANPTHYAVALRYSREEGGAPLVIAKGQNLLALAIRERAEALSIPVVEDKPLARALYAQVEVDAMIPPEFYRAVAGILNMLAQQRRRA